MSSTKKLILLSLILWPLIYSILSFPFFWSMSLVSLTQLPFTIIIIQFVTLIILLIAFILFSLHLYCNPEVDNQAKLMWFVGFIFAWAFVPIFYWKKHIW